EPLGVFTHQPSGARNRRPRRSARRAIELRKHHVPNAVPRVVQILVRFVLDPPLTALRKILPEVRARDLEQRTNYAAAPRMDAAESRQSRAANQLQEKRLCLIVLRMAYGNTLRSQRVGGLLHKVISDPAGRIFD